MKSPPSTTRTARRRPRRTRRAGAADAARVGGLEPRGAAHERPVALTPMLPVPTRWFMSPAREYAPGPGFGGALSESSMKSYDVGIEGALGARL